MLLVAGGALIPLVAGCQADEETVLREPTRTAATPVPTITTAQPTTPIRGTPETPPTAATEPTPPAVSTTSTSTPAAEASRSPSREPTSTPSPSPTASPTPVPLPISPLSGLTNAAEIAERRPIAVKIPNDPGSRPATGLSQAEVVYEHETEGDITRFTAFFVLSDLRKVGPIRSARPAAVRGP